MKPITDTSFIKRPLFKKGKVRDIYEVEDLLLIISTDRISAFDVVMDEGIPGKGEVLNQLAKFWFEKTEDIIPNHFVSSSIDDLPPDIQEFKEYLEGRFMLVKKTKPLPVECVVRGYLAGGGWEEYKRSGKISGVPLPAGLKKSAKLPSPVFTPATKAAVGEHDVNVTFDDIERIIGSELARKVREVSLKLYERGGSIANSRGIILADTKFEFGLANGELLLIDELFTPDSSRFWQKEGYAPGRNLESLDKQFLRDWLESRHWNKKPPPPKLPPHIVEQTATRYQYIKRILLGENDIEKGER